MSEPYHFRPAEGRALPLLVSIPHTGTEVPGDLESRFASDIVRALPDTDWHLHDLYDFVPQLGARTLFARYSRYVVDLNRAPDSAPLYPGRYETTMVPTRTFEGEPIYREGEAPDDEEVEARRTRYWAPYHTRLQQELAELKEAHGYALLWDAHSIRSEVPLLFDGHLPQLVLGDVNGSSTARERSDAVMRVLEKSGHGHAHNAPFRGGYITRAYGRPEEGVHAVQLEMCQDIYMDESPPFPYDPARAASLAVVLKDALMAFAKRP